MSVRGPYRAPDRPGPSWCPAGPRRHPSMVSTMRNRAAPDSMRA